MIPLKRLTCKKLVNNEDKSTTVELPPLNRTISVGGTHSSINSSDAAASASVDFQSMAHQALVVASPGVVTARLEDLPYSNLRKGMRIAQLRT